MGVKADDCPDAFHQPGKHPTLYPLTGELDLKFYTNPAHKPTSFPHKKSDAHQGAPLVLRLRPVPGQPQVLLRLFLPPPPAYQAQAQ